MNENLAAQVLAALVAVRIAAAASAWAGGLTDGTEAYPDHAATVAVNRALGA